MSRIKLNEHKRCSCTGAGQAAPGEQDELFEELAQCQDVDPGKRSGVVTQQARANLPQQRLAQLEKELEKAHGLIEALMQGQVGSANEHEREQRIRLLIGCKESKCPLAQ